MPTTVLSLEFHQVPEKQKNLGKDNPTFSPNVPKNGGNEESEKGYVCRIFPKIFQAVCLLRSANTVNAVVA